MQRDGGSGGVRHFLSIISGVSRRPERERVTLHEVARLAGVSYATASRVLNGSDRTVRPENVDRVRAAAAEVGYRPDLSAQAIARGSTRTAALVVGGVDDPYFLLVAAGVTDAAEASGLILTMAVTDRSPELELRIVRTLRGQRPYAIVIAGSRIDGSGQGSALAAELAAYRRAGGRVVLISQAELPFATLAVDNYGGARRLALVLAGLGYRRFAVLHGGDRIHTSADRRRGLTDGLREAGLEPTLSLAVDFGRDGGLEGARRILAAGCPAEAIVAVTDVMAIGAMSALRDAGLVPGRDIAVAGFDDIDAASDVTPALTTVRVPLRDAGRQALELALSGDGDTVVNIPTEVVLRASTPGIG